MKKFIMILLLTVGITATTHKASAQTQDLQQLILDIEKLTQFKAILSDMKTGYTILTQGYGEIEDLSKGNFNLHSAFLNSLMAISPEVRKYGRIADIISEQASIVSEYKATLKEANASGHFNAQEIIYMNQVFSQLLTQSVNNLTNLTNIITAGTLRMSDAERLQAIDHIYSDTQNKLVFLRNFDSQVAILALQRQKEQNDAQSLKNIY
ncbi:TerB family tellurite resistance protein [Mucilaginibacter sp.]